MRANIGPVITVPPICFGLALSKMKVVKASKPDRNSGLNLCNCMLEANFCIQCYWPEYSSWFSKTGGDTHRKLIKFLEIILVVWRSHKGETFSVRKKGSNGFSNLIIIKFRIKSSIKNRKLKWRQKIKHNCEISSKRLKVAISDSSRKSMVILTITGAKCWHPKVSCVAKVRLQFSPWEWWYRQGI